VRGRFDLLPLYETEPFTEDDGEVRHGGSPFSLHWLRIEIQTDPRIDDLIPSNLCGNSVQSVVGLPLTTLTAD
jgi:hypothetical protein